MESRTPGSDDACGTRVSEGDADSEDVAADESREEVGRQRLVSASAPKRLRLVVALLVAAVVASGWVILDLVQPMDAGVAGTPGASAGPVSEYPPEVRGERVQLSGTTLTDDPLNVTDLRGRVVVINVWGSWCVPCREEAPVLARVSREYVDDGVRFVGVNVKDNRAAALAFEERYGIPYPSIEDRDGQALLALSQHVPAQAVPVTLVLDTDGRVAARVLGLVRETTLRALLDRVVAEVRA